jgi:hypothetical protein
VGRCCHVSVRWETKEKLGSQIIPILDNPAAAGGYCVERAITLLSDYFYYFRWVRVKGEVGINSNKGPVFLQKCRDVLDAI